MMRSFLFLLAITAPLFAGCGSTAGVAVGDPCTDEGQTAECTESALCAKTTGGVLECMLVCEQQTDCPANTNCTGTTGSQKVCQP